MLRYQPQPIVDIAGAVAPVDLAGTNVPAIAGMKFSAVAEVHSSAVDDEGDPSVVRTSRQRSAVILDSMAAPGKDGGPMEEISVLEPLEHSVLEVSLEGGDSSIVDRIVATGTVRAFGSGGSPGSGGRFGC